MRSAGPRNRPAPPSARSGANIPMRRLTYAPRPSGKQRKTSAEPRSSWEALHGRTSRREWRRHQASSLKTSPAQAPQREEVGAGLLDPEAIFASLAEAKKLLLAVSGGPDSVALMLLSARWPRRDAPPIEVATVDHRLREDSRQEAEQVGNWARALGFGHHILTWEGEKPKTRLQERAREARYRLLEERAAHAGADHIVTAHHADDQAETVLLRLTRGSGPAGLAGMAAYTRLGAVTLARPLLGVPKADLRSEERRVGKEVRSIGG